MEICDRCGKECPVTWAMRGPVKTELVCMECKPRRKPKERNAHVTEPFRSIINAATPFVKAG